ncbi:flagellin lysine-N-methylase [uncultured Tolumonas sp.]|uniref:flagellin lysine-N-methylase n=1 Tax=uncultured Tolumonas sp. TaxID=263765 RepID=UPI00292F5EDA|nr:flagellin lysine-N-methylase [uncultured Tolumonas sp.]
MSDLLEIIEPQYFSGFKCIASDCPDSCCIGWDVVIDEETYNKYKSCDIDILKESFRNNIVRNENNIGISNYIPYAFVKLNNNACSFLTGERLCFIQKNLSESFLSQTCSTYPRVINVVDSVLERYLCVSCPEAARLVLLNKDPIRLINAGYSEKNINNYRVNTLHTRGNDKYLFFKESRQFCIDLMQNRMFTVWQRLLVMGEFCLALDLINHEDRMADIECVIADFNKPFINDLLKKFDSYDSDHTSQLQAVKILLDYSLNDRFISDRYREYVNKFEQGLYLTGDYLFQNSVVEYKNAYFKYYSPLMIEHDYVFENYIVNHMLKEIFPHVSHSNGLTANYSIYDKYILLVLQVAMTKSLLIGISGYYNEKFSIEHVVNVIQVFTKNISHNQIYLHQALEFIKAAKMDNIEGVMTLIKNTCL